MLCDGQVAQFAEKQIGSHHTDLFQVLQLVMRKLSEEQGCPEPGLPSLDGFLFNSSTMPDLKEEKQYGEYRTKRVILDIYDEMSRAIQTGQPYRTRAPAARRGTIVKNVILSAFLSSPSRVILRCAQDDKERSG